MHQHALKIWLGGSAIGCLTLFFASRRRLFIRMFAQRDDLRSICRSMPRDPDFRRGLRLMGYLQLVAAAVMGIVVYWLDP